MNQIKEKTYKFLSQSTSHGFPRMVTSDHILFKGFWVVFTTLSLGYCLYVCYQTVDYYYSWPIVTNVKRITSAPFIFPTMTICSANDYWKTYKNGQRQERNRTFDHTIEQFLLLNESRMSGENLNKSQLEFFKIAHFFGDCLRFNGNGTETVKRTDELLTITLYKTVEIKISNTESISHSLATPSYEIYVNDTYMKSLLNYHGFSVDVGSSDMMGLQKVETEIKLPLPYNNCTDTAEVSYRIDNCVEICINAEIKKKYNCSIQSYYMYTDLKQCNITDQPASIASYQKNLGLLIGQFHSLCMEQCEQECTLFKFDLRTTRSALSTSNTTVFRFYVRDFSTLEITQIAKIGIFDIISNIGGLLGLFIGVSFLTFMEIVEYIIDVFLVLCFA